MIVGVIGSGAIGPDLAYGFLSALSTPPVSPPGGQAGEPGTKVYLVDIKEEALAAGTKRIEGYVQKGVSRGKITAASAKSLREALVPTRSLADLAACDYVIEAASEDLAIKRRILADLEAVVRPDCLIGFATSGIPRKQIAAEAKHPERCFVNHPFYPAWRSLPIEIVASEDAALTQRMIDTTKKLGRVPIVTADVECFAADDVFCNYISEAARIVEEGKATPAEVDAIVHAAIGGGGPFNVMDLTKGNLLVHKCQVLMQKAATGTPWFAPPAILAKQGDQPWHPRGTVPSVTPERAREIGGHVMDRILAVLFARAYEVVENGTCEASDTNWLLRMSLGFDKGTLELAESTGAARVREICAKHAAAFPGFRVPQCLMIAPASPRNSIQEERLPAFFTSIRVERPAANAPDGQRIAVVRVFRPEAKNALSKRTLAEIDRAIAALEADASVEGIVLTSFDGAFAGADILELAALPDPEACKKTCLDSHPIFQRIERCKKPIVAALDGPVLGGGAEIAMACHARVVGPKLVLGQPEVNLGIIPGYGGTQRLPRLIGFERAANLLRTGKTVGAKDACSWGWAHGQPAADFEVVAKKLVSAHVRGELRLQPVDPAPIAVPDALPAVSLGHRSLAIDAILVSVLREGLTKPLAEGLAVEAGGFARCKSTVDMDIGMKNFIQNGPRVPAAFLHE